ncbi:MAG: hypothetical protein J6M62_02620 [Selenomonadaceae bacterium]|nr:hypothetical protein [Selenomonadaceae bacterium]MBP3723820.1 hypothetical protein [Selenomonadaceae bacterium]
MLTLPIKKKWYDMILSGEKREEYRQRSSYWEKRFESLGLLRKGGDGVYKVLNHRTCFVKFRNGYSRNSPFFYAEIKLSIGEGKSEWGAKEGEKYLILTILEIYTEYKILTELQSQVAKGSRYYEALEVAIKALNERKGG